MPEHQKLWGDWCDRYYLKLLDMGRNGIPAPPKSFKDMEEPEINSWVSNVELAESTNVGEKKYKVKVPVKQEFCKNSQVTKTDVINLPLSLENNATLTGTAAILKEFGKEFSIPCPQINEIPFNKSDKKFDIMAVRTQYDFIRSVDIHQTEMSEMEKQLTSMEKDLDGSTFAGESNSDSESDNSEDGLTREPVLASTKSLQEQKNEKFAEVCGRIKRLVQQSVLSSNDSFFDNLVQQQTSDMKEINSVKDMYKRTVFHHAVEHKNYLLAKVLLTVGINPNCKEGCGATPMSLAVLNADVNMCKLLLDNFAQYSGALFGSFPTPMEMATAMDLTEIVELFNKHSKQNEYPFISLLQKDNCSSTHDQPKNIDIEEFELDETSGETLQTKSKYLYNRSVYEGFPTALIGDVGTCKVNRSVKNKNNTAYKWSTEIPGDMHARGHLCEAAFKAHGKGGFHSCKICYEKTKAHG